jgi:hypothetical protein
MVQGGDGEDVPGVGGNDEGGDEIDLASGVGAATVADGADIGVGALFAGALDLDAEELSVVLHGKIVGSVFAPGLGDAESELGGAGHEAQFGPLAALFGAADAHAGSFHIC